MATHAATTLQATSAGVSLITFAVFWYLVFRRPRPGRRRPWFCIVMLAITAAAFGALALGLFAKFPPAPPFPFG